MSIIPKIKVGMPKRREKLNLSFDCSTTGNIGSVQPTMCREMVPNEKFSVQVGSFVRLLALNTPTFGRMSLRHYHVYVPYKEIWEPFECMLSGQHYHNGTSNFIPTATPYFTMNAILKHIIMNFSEVSCYHRNGDGSIGDPVYFDPTREDKTIAQQMIEINGAWDILRGGVEIFPGCTGSVNAWNAKGEGDLSDTGYGFWNLGNFNVYAQYTKSDLVGPVYGSSTPTDIIPVSGGQSILTPEGADYVTGTGDFVWCFKLKPVAKNFRRIMIGLGYQFSPYSAGLEFNPFKLIAYYKAWFELFRPVRGISFQDTNCYKLCHWMRNQNGTTIDNEGFFVNLLFDIAKDSYYYLPMDYFSMATTAAAQPNSEESFTITSPTGGIDGSGAVYTNNIATAKQKGSTEQGAAVASPNLGVTIPNTSLSTQGLNPIAMKMAMRLYTFANKNTVIGRSVRQWLKVHYGVSGDEHSDFNAVYRIGASRVRIDVSDVLSTAETSDMPLGGFAGKGTGSGKSETFDFTASEFGCWLTLSTIVPESGYYQGYLAENRHRNRYQFFVDEFDACGYQVLERGEVIDDYNCDGANWQPAQGVTLSSGQSGFNRSAAFGLVPRYSEYKVGRNIVNGDLSLFGMYNSMAPYTLDRRIPAGAVGNISGAADWDVDTDPDNPKLLRMYWKRGIVKPLFVPTVVYDNFRRIDPSDHLGQYNRIFTYGRNDIDHFIIHNVFSVDAYAPMKSLTSSFDTVQEGDKVIDVTHS